MRICLISVEIFAWSKYGGFGRATRIIGRELARRGIEVCAVVPRRPGQNRVEELDGIRVYGFTNRELLNPSEIYRLPDADVYHSEEPSLGTYMAMRTMPQRKHIITFRDTRDAGDWKIEFSLPTMNPARVVANWLYEDNWLVKQSVRRAHGWFCAAKMLIPKARAKYRLPADPVFLPTPVAIPENVEKSQTPTVCFFSRWDKRKRPEIFFELAKSFPNVRFLAAGKSHNKTWDRQLRETYGRVPNLEFLGFIDQFRGDEFSRILGQSWILINTSAREGLPNAFIEAAAHGCAILSAVDPDSFASQFGQVVRDDDYSSALETLLEQDSWRERGGLARDYVREIFNIDNAIDRHLAIYEQLIGN